MTMMLCRLCIWMLLALVQALDLGLNQFTHGALELLALLTIISEFIVDGNNMEGSFPNYTASHHIKVPRTTSAATCSAGAQSALMLPQFMCAALPIGSKIQSCVSKPNVGMTACMLHLPFCNTHMRKGLMKCSLTFAIGVVSARCFKKCRRQHSANFSACVPPNYL